MTTLTQLSLLATSLVSSLVLTGIASAEPGISQLDHTNPSIDRATRRAAGVNAPAVPAQRDREWSHSIDRRVAPVLNAIELAVGGAAMRNTGRAGDDLGSMKNMTSGGGGAEVQLGLRVTRNLTLGTYGTIAGYNVAGNFGPAADTSIGFTAGLKADWHFRPSRAIDPWISYGAGWRMLWLGTESTTAVKLRGIDIARIQVGVDYRITPDIAISPVLGASATMFLERGTMDSEWQNIHDRKVGVSVTGGLLARFDLFGTRGW